MWYCQEKNNIYGVYVKENRNYNSYMMINVPVIRKELGKKIRALRKERRLTQEELGELAGLSYKFIGEVERGVVNISLDSIVKISNALGVEPQELFVDRKALLSPEERRVLKKALELLARFV